VVWICFPGEDELLSPPQDTSTGLEEVMEQLNNSFPSSRGERCCPRQMRGGKIKVLFCSLMFAGGCVFVSGFLLLFVFILTVAVEKPVLFRVEKQPTPPLP